MPRSKKSLRSLFRTIRLDVWKSWDHRRVVSGWTEKAEEAEHRDDSVADAKPEDPEVKARAANVVLGSKASAGVD